MDSRYSYLSPNYDRNFDQSGGTLVGKEFSVTLHPDDIPICAAVGMQCFEQPGHLFPATLRKHDGKGRFVVTQWEMQAFFDEAQQPAGIFCIGYNITDYVDTRSRLDNPTDQLKQIGFIQSHVIRKPLANIMGLASILDNMLMDSNQKNVAGMMIVSVQEPDSVIRDISDKTS